MALEVGELLQAHFQNGGRLQGRKLKLFNQIGMGVGNVFGGADRFYYFVYMVKCFFKPEQYMLALCGACQVKLRAAAHNYLPVLDKLLQNSLERKRSWHAVYQHHHVEVEGVLERGVFVEVV